MANDHTRLSRNDFLQATATALARSHSSGSYVGLLVAKIANMQDINRALGYTKGDEVLDYTKRLIEGSLRPTDIIAHFGGPHVAILIPGLVQPAHLELIINKVLGLLDEPLLESDRDDVAMTISLCVGGSVGKSPDTTADALMLQAEAALHDTIAGLTPYCIRDYSTTEGSDRRTVLETQLKRGIAEGELLMNYQPQIDLQTRRITGFESLVRWESSIHGRLVPDLFIPLAERTGLILPLTLWTLNASLKEFGYQVTEKKIDLSINLSAPLLNQPDLVYQVTDALAIWGVDPCRLVLEITETAMLNNPDASLETLRLLTGKGIRISIDDFGIGYSSLAYLKQLPVSELKIDKSFVLNMETNPANRDIAQAIIDLAHNFEMKVVAEGIEDQKTMDDLQSMGCDIGQGFYIAHPLPAADVQDWIQYSDYGNAEPESNSTLSAPLKTKK